MNISQRVQVNSIAASYSFVHFLTLAGQIYSLGSNKNGQLGIDGQKSKVVEPMLNEFLANKK